MPLLWDNLAKQLESVRAGGGFDYSAWASLAAAPIQGSRDERLKMALDAIQDSGNPQMIESLNAALEGREASFDLPPIEWTTGFSQDVESKSLPGHSFGRSCL